METSVTAARKHSDRESTSEVESPATLAPRDALVAALHSGAHYLPSQGPIETFIHHNTLHAFESRRFHEALSAAAARTGATSYLDESEFRQMLAEGRISRRDLDRAIAARDIVTTGDRVFDDVLSDRRRILWASLLNDLSAEPAPRIRWRFSEDIALGEPGDDDRWAASVEVVRQVGRGPIPDLVGRTRDLLADLGPRSHRDIALAMTGVDVSSAVDQWMTRECASHLDEGLATAPPPQRLGLYERWRRQQRPGRHQLAGLRRDIVLPEDPIDAACLALDALGVTTDAYDQYVSRMLQHAPGWAGMFHWRETHPEYRPELSPASLVDFAAVRLVAEWSELEGLARDHWRCPAKQMIAYLRDHLDEAVVRVALFSGELRDRVARRVRRALLLSPADRTAPCALLARDVIAADEGPELVRAWQLHKAARALRLDGIELRGAPPERVATMLATLDELGPDIRLPIWQDAYELHYRDQILEAITDNRSHRIPVPADAPFAVITCIDDREEAFRRHIEEIEPRAVTYGAGGFFGIPIAFLGRDEDEFSALCPLGVTPSHRVLEVAAHHAPELGSRFDDGRRLIRSWRAHWRQIHGHGWASLLGAYAAGFVAWISLVVGLVFPRRVEQLRRPLRRLLMPEHDTCFITDEPAPPPDALAGFPIAEQITRVAATFDNIGLRKGFPRLIAVLGHGSHSVNNPHLSAYDCGACGGRHGGPNARLFAAMANTPAVRDGLRKLGIDVPDSTWFVGGEHNTANEDVTWSDRDRVPADHAADVASLLVVLDEARRRSAHERCRKFEHAPIGGTPEEALVHVQERSIDPRQARPELGHVTNAVAVFGRRTLTRGVFFDRRMFLVSYDADVDPQGLILERLLLALSPVAAGISLEYYFSRVDIARYGAGTKLPHNVVGLIGVMDGGTSDLRTGLPRQMIEIHEPMRLHVVLEAKAELVAAIVGRQPMLQEMLDNAWIHVALVDPDTGVTTIYTPGQGLVPWRSRGHRLPVVTRSADWYAGRMDFVPPARIEANRASVAGRPRAL